MGGTLFFRDLIVYTILAIFVLYVTRTNNLWGTKRGTSKTKVEARKYKSDVKKRGYLLKLLNALIKTGENFGFKPTEDKLVRYKYNIMRSRQNFKLLGRAIKPMELIGLFKVVKFIGLFCTILSLTLTKNPFSFIFTIGVFIEPIYLFFIEGNIVAEDKEIEEDFPDLFLLLYSRLLKGAQVRLAPTLDEYLKSIDVVHGEESHKAIRYFVQDLRNNIEIYGDDSMALHKMREYYKSAMLVNFFNLAIQSLRGVNNSDKLLGFKMELTQKRLEAMTEKAKKLVLKGQRAIWAIMIILFQFVILSWAAKAGLSNLTNLFGG